MCSEEIHTNMRSYTGQRTLANEIAPRSKMRGKRHGVPCGSSSCRPATAQVQFSGRPLCKVPPFARSVICRKNAAHVNATARSAKASITCACAWTASIIARIAGKPAKSLSPAAVAIEPRSFDLQLDADVRLAAAVGGAARYLADSAGMETDAISQLQSSVVAACREAFEDLTRDAPQLHVTLTRYADRIEVALCHRGCFARRGTRQDCGICRTGCGQRRCARHLRGRRSRPVRNARRRSCHSPNEIHRRSQSTHLTAPKKLKSQTV